MPIYEYECASCRRHFERRQSVHESPVQTCPECGGQTRRVIHPVGIIFKGSGFYVTDNRKPSTPATSTAGDKENGTNGKSEPSVATEPAKSGPTKSDAADKPVGSAST